MSLSGGNGGAWKSISPYAGHASTWKLALTVHGGNGGAWGLIGQVLSAVSVTGDGSYANGTSPVVLGSSVTGGYGTLTYLWTKVTGTGTISGSATGATVNIASGANDATGEFRVTVTDSLTGGSVQNDGIITWGTPP